MNATERRALREAIDQRRRRSFERCEWCDREMPPHPNGELKRFCSAVHRAAEQRRRRQILDRVGV
jgi:hypothetical protein